MAGMADILLADQTTDYKTDPAQPGRITFGRTPRFGGAYLCGRDMYCPSDHYAGDFMSQHSRAIMHMSGTHSWGLSAAQHIRKALIAAYYSLEPLGQVHVSTRCRARESRAPHLYTDVCMQHLKRRSRANAGSHPRREALISWPSLDASKAHGR